MYIVLYKWNGKVCADHRKTYAEACIHRDHVLNNIYSDWAIIVKEATSEC